MSTKEEEIRKFLTTSTEGIGWERILINALLTVLDEPCRSKPDPMWTYRNDMISATHAALFGNEDGN